jgi:hypothetical protein
MKQSIRTGLLLSTYVVLAFSTIAQQALAEGSVTKTRSVSTVLLRNRCISYTQNHFEGGKINGNEITFIASTYVAKVLCTDNKASVTVNSSRPGYKADWEAGRMLEYYSQKLISAPSSGI